LELREGLYEYIQGIRRAGAAALDLCWVAAGRVEWLLGVAAQAVGCAAGKLIVEEAGGRLSDFFRTTLSGLWEQTLATERADPPRNAQGHERFGALKNSLK